MKMTGSPLQMSARTLVAPVLWGTTYVTVTELLPADRPLTVAALRVLPAALILLAVATVRAGRVPRPTRLDRLTVLALVNFGVFFPLLIVGVYRLPGGVAAAVGGLQPLLVAGWYRLVEGRRPTVRQIVVAIAALIGVAMIVVRPGAGIDPVGVLAAVGANLSFSLGVVLSHRWPALAGTRVAATGWQLAIGAAVLVPLALVVEGLPPQPSALNLLGYSHLGVVATGLAFLLWFDGIPRLPTVAPPLLGLAVPVTSATLGWIVLSEDLTIAQLVGFVITLSAIASGGLAGRRAEGDPTPRPDTATVLDDAETNRGADGTGPEPLGMFVGSR